MQYRKNRFSQTLPEQRPRWTSSKNISFRSFRFLFIFLEFFLYFALSSGLNWHRNRTFSGSSRFKSGGVLEKINPANQKTLFPLLIAGEKFERELNLNFWRFFLNLCFATEVTNSEFGRNSRLKKAFWYMASPNETTLWGKTIISSTRWAKKKLG